MEIFQEDNNTHFLIDNYGRRLDYLRISVTERCNLRCRYCMPVEGISHLDHNQVLTFEEIIYLGKVFYSLGVKKFRFTGGEPFVRKDFIELLKNFKKELSSADIHLTTNGTLLSDHLAELENLEIQSINLSLDSLKPEKFNTITRRDEFAKVRLVLDQLLNSRIKLKINIVVQPDFNTDEIIDFARLAEDHNVEVRFIEQMKFNGTGGIDNTWDGKKIFAELAKSYPDIKATNQIITTAENYTSEKFKGTLGIINGHSRTFCSTCIRLRLTADGNLKTCLYDDGVLNLRDMIRNGEESKIIDSINRVVKQRFKDGFKTEEHFNKINNSMAAIGG